MGSAVIGILHATNKSSSTTESSQQPVAAPPAAAPEATPLTEPETTTVVTTLLVAQDPEAAAPTEVQTTAANHQTTVNSLLDQWVPQLASKKVGLSNPRDPWFPDRPDDNQVILQGYERFQQQLNGSELTLDSRNDISFVPGHWVLIVVEPFPDAKSMISWCRSQGLNDDDCATLVSNTTPEGDGTYPPLVNSCRHRGLARHR